MQCAIVKGLMCARQHVKNEILFSLFSTDGVHCALFWLIENVAFLPLFDIMRAKLIVIGLKLNVDLNGTELLASVTSSL